MDNATKSVQRLAVVGARFIRRGIAQARALAKPAVAEFDACGERLRRAKDSVSSIPGRLIAMVNLTIHRVADLARIDRTADCGAPRARDVVVVDATMENEKADPVLRARWRIFCFAAVVALHAGCAIAASAAPLHEEPYDSGWAFYMDNDAFAPRPTDRDYTGGFSLTMAGRRATEGWWSLDGLRAATDHLFRLDHLYADRTLSRHSEEVGVTVFTPGELSDPAKQVGDRPYASLIYLANTAAEVAPARNTAYLSTFTLGVLGAPVVGNLQRALHRAIGSTEPVGWENQISAGGEPTLRYAFARVNRIWRGTLGGSLGEMTSTWRGSIGYLTDASFGLATRIGEIRTPWWSYNPQIAEYAEKSVPVVASEGGGEEHYLWAGFNVRARLYNAFLQGQFRHSEVTFSADQLNPLILEGWIGYTWAFRSGWRMSYVLRSQSSEIRNGPADRTETWGGVIISFAR